jgi:serine/threonine protein kinase
MSYRNHPKYRHLTVEVDTTQEQATRRNYTIVQKIKEQYYPHYELFRPYLKHFYDKDLTPYSLRAIQYKINDLYKKATEHLLKPIENVMKTSYINHIIDKKTPFCVHKKQNGLVVQLYNINKLSQYLYTKKPYILKTYLFEEKEYNYHSDVSFMYADMIKRNITNEIVFQTYADEIRKKENKEMDFIVPKIYDFGQFDYINKTGVKMKCYYILMEYIEGITLKEALANHGHAKMYEIMKKVNEADVALKTNLLHHNDLNHNNVLVLPTEKPCVAIIDYGEAAYGPHNGFVPVEGQFVNEPCKPSCFW